MARQRRRLSLTLVFVPAATFLSVALLVLTWNGLDRFFLAGVEVLPATASVSIINFSDQVLLPSQNSSRTFTLPSPIVVSHGALAASMPLQPFRARSAAFLGSHPPCKPRFFMTWISKIDIFGQRELVSAESIFKFHPQACLLILSSTMDSAAGAGLLKPLQDRGFRVTAMAPDMAYFLHNTPAIRWFRMLQQGQLNPGEVPLGQNLSNLLRLAVLYKFGGVYIDTDVIVLKEFSTLRNVIGAQSVDATGNWSRLNNAVMVFDKKHPLLYEFIREFALTFDGSRWGHNGPYLVSRVTERVKGMREFMFSVAPPPAFYPVIWNRIEWCFKRPGDRMHEKWVVAKMENMRRESFAIHLWNRQSRDMEVEERSLIGRVLSTSCVLCNSSSPSKSK